MVPVPEKHTEGHEQRAYEKKAVEGKNEGNRSKRIPLWETKPLVNRLCHWERWPTSFCFSHRKEQLFHPVTLSDISQMGSWINAADITRNHGSLCFHCLKKWKNRTLLKLLVRSCFAVNWYMDEGYQDITERGKRRALELHKGLPYNVIVFALTLTYNFAVCSNPG